MIHIVSLPAEGYNSKILKDSAGFYHCEDGPAIKYPNGYEAWYFHGFLHRVNGPAIIDDGYNAWHVHGKRHRVDGPAIERSDGINYWFFNGKHYDVHTLQEFQIAVIMNT
jgi:hypothetical protein